MTKASRKRAATLKSRARSGKLEVMQLRGLGVLSLFCASLLAQAPVTLRVDATDAARRLFHVRMSMPAKPGPLTLLYPEWIPGEHGPTGPITNFVGLEIKASGQTIPWKRDSVNMFAFHVDVPAGATTLDLVFDFIAPPESSGFSSGASATTELAVVNWNQLLLYPDGSDPESMQFQANLKLPNSWKYGTALPIRREAGNEIEFQPASLDHPDRFSALGGRALPDHRAGYGPRHSALPAHRRR